MNKLKVYFSSGWFTENQDRVCTKLEEFLRSRPDIKPYFPRHDGTKLEANQFHDPKIRERVFLDNVENIDSADFIVTNLDGKDGFLDTGTVWEDGYAMAKGIPVIAYQDSPDSGMENLIGAVSNEFTFVCTGLVELSDAIDRMMSVKSVKKGFTKSTGSKVLYIAPDDTEKNKQNGNDLANVIIECFGSNFKWVDDLSNKSIASNIDKIFEDINFMVAVIDDKHPLVSWMMGQCYARKIPIISYTNYDHGVNLMLMLSIVQHVQGIDKMKEMLQLVKRDGIDSIDGFDNSNIKVF